MLDYITKLFMFVLAVAATGVAAIITIYVIGVVAVIANNIKKTLAKSKETIDISKDAE